MSKPTSSKTAPTPERVSFVFGSKYIFHQPEDLTQQFTSEDIDCVYNDDLFTLTCPVRTREATSAAFQDAWQAYIQQSLEGNEDVLEGARISEKEPFFEEEFDWEGLLEGLEQPFDEPQSPENFKLEATLEEPPPVPLIEHEALSKSFQRHGLANTPFSELYSPNVLHDVQIAANCRIEIDSISGVISVMGDDEANIDRAIIKLSNLEKIDADRKSRSWKSNFYLSNDKAMWRFGLLRDDLLIDRSFLNTGRAFYRILKMPYIEAVNLYKTQTFARHAIVYDWESSRFWIGYEYPAFGKPENNPANWVSGSAVSTTGTSVADNPLLPLGKVGTVKEWLPKASGAQADPFKPPPEDKYNDRGNSTQDLARYRTTLRSTEGTKEEAVAPAERVLAEAGHYHALKPIMEEEDGQERNPSFTTTVLPQDQLRKLGASREGDLLLPNEGEDVVAEPVSNADAPIDAQQPFVNDEWPSPETAMAIPEHSWTRGRHLKQKSKDKGRGHARVAASTKPTPIPAQAPAPLPAANLPVGPVARFAAEFHARRVAQPKPPPPIEAPYMPPANIAALALDRPSKRRMAHGTSHHEQRSILRTSTDQGSSKPDDGVQKFIDSVIESNKRGKCASLKTVLADMKPKPRLNPLAPTWEPGKIAHFIGTNPVPPILQPLPTRQPFFGVENGQETTVDPGDATEAVSDLIIDENLPNRNLSKQSMAIPLNIEGFLSAVEDAEEPLMDSSYDDESPIRSDIRELAIAGIDMAAFSLKTAPKSANLQRWFNPSAAPFIPALNSLTSANDQELAHSTLQTSSSPPPVVQQDMVETEDLLVFDGSEDEVEEMRELIPETVSRTFLDGASLFAPSMPQGISVQIGPAIAHDQIMVAAIEGLDMLRAARGYISLQLDIGHMLVPELPYHKIPDKNGFSPDEWKTQMDPTRPWSMGKNVVFSKVLTPNWFDAEWMCDCPDATGARIFDESSRQERVFYEIKCHNKSNEAKHILTLETNGSYEILSAPKFEAEINILFADYNWDAQLTAHSQAKPNALDKHNLMSIIENMFIPGGTRLPELYTRCNKTFIEISSILVKRRYSYEASACSDFALQMTEVIDLPIEKSSHNQQYRAVAVEEDIVKNHRRWYEASIISTAAQSILTENINLEVGEYAKWTTARLKQAGFVQDLLALASGLISNSDAVGCPTAGFLPELDPARKAAAAEARRMRGFTGSPARSRWTPSRPHTQAPVTIVPPNGVLPPTPQGVPATQRAGTNAPGSYVPGRVGSEKEGEAVRRGQQRPSGFW